ncbi:AAA family ATPase [Clostridium sp.]|uniref:AAA family ATPase n=1 Tax=Clostridium sp. TaxID=1506 RepID=UPI00260A97AA|nr:AAA family ATPase [Clostridium sp.]
MNNHFITQIEIEKIKHLNNIKIKLDENKPKHLLLTGKNGSGKTTTLKAIKSNLRSIQMGNYIEVIEVWKKNVLEAKEKLNNEINENIRLRLKNDIENNINNINSCGIYGLNIKYNCDGKLLNPLYKEGKFILAYYGANRATEVEIPKGVEKITLKDVYNFDENPSGIFLKYLVDLKTQQSFARNEEDMETVNNIDIWFKNFEGAMRTILDDNSIKLKFDYRNYDFKIIQDNREPYSFNELSDGYSSILNIVSDLILRIDKNRAGLSSGYIFDTEGIVLIDELETHLHIELQKSILPFLTQFFPNIQFIVTTHSPFVLNSINNTIIYDLEKNIRLEGLSDYSYEGIVEGYFEVDNYSNELKEKINKYKELAFKTDLNDEDKALRAELRIEIKNSANDLAKELKVEFDEIERKRKTMK